MTKPAPRPWCALVGAGPGDPDLLTLKALKTLRRATLVLVDDLVSDAVLARALAGRRRPPRVVHVGKRGGCRSTPQDFIERLMVRSALAGERVVRLKGGDPLIFGRGGEEAEVLRRHGIEVELVNGITAGLAAAGAIGAPLTHRHHAQGVMIVTAHRQAGAAAPDWGVLAAAAAEGLTLVVYMGVAQVEAVVAGLRTRLPGATPAAVAQAVGTAEERHAVTTLEDLTATVREGGFASPAVLIIGDVLRARPALEHPALAGGRLCG